MLRPWGDKNAGPEGQLVRTLRGPEQDSGFTSQNFVTPQRKLGSVNLRPGTPALCTLLASGGLRVVTIHTK